MKHIVGGLALAALLGGSALAHHSTTAEFDMTKATIVTGTLTKVDWVNPHIFIFVDSKTPSAVENWKLETNPPAWFRRVSVGRADFAKAIGQTVTVSVRRAKDGSFYGYATKFTFGNGEVLELVDGNNPTP